MRRPPLTDRVREAALLLAAFVVTVGTVGWLLGYDTDGLQPVLMAVVTLMAAGEASNVGKRATTKPELVKDGEDA